MLVLTILIAMTGCATPGLMATPNLFERGYPNPFASVPESLRHNRATVLYATDRAPIQDESGAITYGYARSKSVAFGAATVEFGEDVPWETLEENSLKPVRTLKLKPALTQVRELGRLTPSNERIEVVNGKAMVSPTVLADEQSKRDQLHVELRKALEHTDRKEVFLFLHGYNVNFEDSIFTAAQVWHFLGRIGVPVSYSWPAGHGGIRGYTADRESGEFTIFHLKQSIRALASCPELKTINIIAHSRGTDVALTALRELHIECQAAGVDTREAFKLGNIVLAAPDLDFEVVTQRVGAEGIFTVPERLTVYISPEDRAIGVSSWLFDSVRRIGKLRLTDLSPFQRKSLASVPGMEIVDARAKRVDLFGHSYFYQSPSVSSDLILILREHRSPGIDNGRPLSREGEGFWMLTNNYPEFPSTAKPANPAAP